MQLVWGEYDYPDAAMLGAASTCSSLMLGDTKITELGIMISFLLDQQVLKVEHTWDVEEQTLQTYLTLLKIHEGGAIYRWTIF